MYTCTGRSCFTCCTCMVCIDRMYPAMENLIEPHRLIACMNCVVAVSRPMLSARKWYPEGRSHILPLLNLSLPGIDPNDFKKSLVTFQMISTFVAQVPIVDCSEAVFVREDLTEVGKVAQHVLKVKVHLQMHVNPSYFLDIS